MAIQIINIGQDANDRKGDSLRTAFSKINVNFADLDSRIGRPPPPNFDGGGAATIFSIDDLNIDGGEASSIYNQNIEGSGA